MPQFDVELVVAYRENVLHPESKSIQDGLQGIGYTQVQAVKAGKHFALRLEASDDNAAKSLALELAEKLLANPVIEDWRVLGCEELTHA